MMDGVVELDGSIWQIDLLERGFPGWTSCYLLKGEGNSGWMLIETGAASSVPRLYEAVEALGVNPGEIKFIGITHIHIDHAGALGTVWPFFENARVWVHPRGMKHLANPGRLISGARAAYGEKKMNSYGAVLPVPEERLLAAGEGSTINLGGRIIEVWLTPGHARHHISFFDHKTKGLFSGDVAGVYANRLSELLDMPVVRPATPGPDFDGRLMLQDLYRIACSDVRKIYYTHFGVGAFPAQLLTELVLGQLHVHMEMARNHLNDGADVSKKLCLALQEYTKKTIIRHLKEKNIPIDIINNEMELLLNPLNNSADGLIGYLQKD